ncbi:MAG: hypothetical protein SGBAC_007897 [Bacillariaceae sp.]
MDEISQAIAANNSGILFLMKKDFRRATASFRHAVVTTKEILSKRHRRNEAQSVFLHYHGAAFPSHQRPSLSQLTMEVVDVDSITKRGAAELYCDEELSLVCRNAFFIHQSTATTRSYIEDDLTTIAVSAVYNLAMAHHLCGIDHRSISQLETAVHYFEVFLSFQKTGIVGLVTAHMMFALNNMATIHRTMSNESKLMQNLQQLCAILAHVDPKYPEKNKRHWMMYMSNLTSLYLNPPITARAA